MGALLLCVMPAIAKMLLADTGKGASGRNLDLSCQ
jgi:hypothetical protein